MREKSITKSTTPAGLTITVRDERTVKGRIDSKDSAGAGLRHALRRQLDRMRSHAPGARADASPKHVHQMRVSIRRMRVIVGAAKGLVPNALRDDVRQRLKELQDVLGEVRDADVALARLDAVSSSLAPGFREGLAAQRARIESRRGDAREAMVAYLDSAAYENVCLGVERLGEVLVLPESADNGAARDSKKYAKVAKRYAKKRLKRAKKTAKRISAESVESDLHQLRKDFKKVRYALELLKPVNGKPVKKALRQLKWVQDKLGAHQDAVVARGLAERGVSAFKEGEEPVEPEVYAALGQLMQHEHETAAVRREAFFHAWDDSSARKQVFKRVKKAL